jgi:hypothetical protein
MSATKLIIATSAILLMAAALAAQDEPRASPDATSAAVTALESNLGNPPGLTIEEVRVTEAGVACIDYRVSDGQGNKALGHAVVQRGEVLKSSSGESFEKAWKEHCLGPRGGTSRNE